MLNNSADLRIESVQLSSPRGKISQSRPVVISHQHDSELYYQGVVKDVVTFTLTADARAVGPEKPVLFLDIFAADSRPYRYKIWRTRDRRDGKMVEWEDIGIPPAPV